MKNYAAIALLACVAFATVASTPSHAQVLLKAEVPFSFCAGHGMLPAGQYSVKNTGSEFALVLSSGQRGIEIMMPKYTEWRSDFAAPELVFHRYGDEYFLAEIWTVADNAVRTLPVNPREKQLARMGAAPQVAVVYGALASPGKN